MRAVLLRSWLGGDAAVVTAALGGRFTMLVRPDDHGPGAEILATGTWEPHLAALWPKLVRPGAAVVDVGANVGFHALHAAVLAGPSGRVLAVEPDPGNARLLRASCRLLAGAAPVEVIEAALSDTDGELVLSDLGNAGNSGARFTHTDAAALQSLVHGPAPTFERVPALRWDARFGDIPVDLVKIDIEGWEPVAVRGMERCIETFRPAVVSEFAPSNVAGLGGTEPAAYLDWFLSRGYRAWIVDEPYGALTPLPGRNWQPETHHADLLFLPGERLPGWVVGPSTST